MRPFILLILLVPAAVAADVYLAKEDSRLRFGNDRIELELDAHSGYFIQIRNKVASIDHKPAADGVWPFGLTVGTREAPDQMKAEIRSDGIQTMGYKLERDGALANLRITYPMLLDNATRKPTGIGLGLTIELAPGRDYFAIRTEIANGGGLWLTRFYAGKGALLTGDENAGREQVRIPTRGGFDRERFRGMTLGLPTYTWGWSDYSGSRGSIGMAYLNKDGIQTVFDIQPAGRGVEQSWRLFDTRGYWHFERSMNDYQKSLLTQPLEPANNYTTGEWLLIPHSGDWHRTADVYRQRYLKMFEGNFQSWETLPDRVRRLYMQFGFFIAENSIGNSYPRKVINKLDTIVPQVSSALEAMGIPANRSSVNLVFSHPNVGRYPEFFPVWEEAGGDVGMKQAIDGLHKLGVSYVIGYAHLAYNHRAAKNYVMEADPGETIPPINPTAGHRACIDNSAWVRLWKNELIPAYRQLGFDGVYADEGHFPWGTCAIVEPHHLHGPSAAGVLTANTRGAIRLHKLLHEGLGEGSVIMVEGAGDVAGRWVDANHAYPDPAVAYTLPFKRYLWFVDALTPEAKLSEHVNLALAHGYALMVNLGEGKSIADPAPFRRYARIRRQIEEADAPGYPRGFRDTVGVTSTHPDLHARAFADGARGITVVYYATAPVDADLRVNPSELGIALDPVTRRVKLPAEEAGFWVLPAR